MMIEQQSPSYPVSIFIAGSHRGANDHRLSLAGHLAAERYVMVRRPGCLPFVVSRGHWLSWPECDKDGLSSGHIARHCGVK